jgi:ParB-like chromosome segregation protein Spo0J
MNIKEININDLYISNINVRKNINNDAINQLSENIAKNGLLNPLTVKFNKKNKKYEILAGQ